MAQQIIETELMDFKRMASDEQQTQQTDALNSLRDFILEGIFSDSDFIMVTGKTMGGERVCHEITMNEEPMSFNIRRFHCTDTEVQDSIFEIVETYKTESDWDFSFVCLQGLVIENIFYVQDETQVMGIYGSSLQMPSRKLV